ncbi:replicative DNA helicase [Gluconobacter potus]|uniref:replicative DNA helicase n=1 Tax=Gluconobacter potus TaxID=2724927 RepID=UPI0039E9CF05
MSENLHGLLQPPQPPALENVMAEQGILASILLRNADFDVVAEILRPEHFSARYRGEIYRICGDAIRNGRFADPVTLRSAFQANDAIAEYGPQKAITEILTGMMAAPHSLLRNYAAEIVDMATRRGVRAIANGVLWGTNEFEDDTATAIISRLQDQLQALAAGSDGTRQAKTASTATDALLADTEASWKAGNYLSGLDCGYETLNKRIRGFRAGAMYVIAGRPGMGKSALGIGIATRMAIAEGRGLYWTGEMPAEELMGRVVSARCGLTLDTVLTGMFDGPNGPEPVSGRTMERIVAAGMEAKRIPLVIDDREGLSVQQVAIRARRMAREPEGLKFIVLDYIGLLRGSDAVRRSGNRVNEVTEISGEIARMARELKVPIIALSQLNRQSENREDRRPGMSDIRESGAIEQDARCILGVYREAHALQSRIGADGSVVRNTNESDAVYQKRAAEFDANLERSRGKGEVLILKNRGGKGGIVDMWFDGPTTWFRDQGEDERGPAW